MPGNELHNPNVTRGSVILAPYNYVHLRPENANTPPQHGRRHFLLLLLIWLIYHICINVPPPPQKKKLLDVPNIGLTDVL